MLVNKFQLISNQTEFMQMFLLVLVSVIEKRLQELHRKLSEIAEIPKILSSTLATVTETFDKLTNSSSLPVTNAPTLSKQNTQKGNKFNFYHNQHDAFDVNEQKRKLSYDEDVYDYELCDEREAVKPAAEEQEEEFDAKEAYLQLKRYAARQRKSKDVTPESDYASESNYQQNEANDFSWHDDKAINSTDYDSDNNAVDDDEDSCDMYEEFNLPLFKIPLGHVNVNGSDTEEIEENDDDDDEERIQIDEQDNDEDFLTTTFTWNIRNKPKLQVNESLNVNHLENHNQNSGKDIFEEESLERNIDQQKSVGEERNIFKSNTPEKEQKLDKLERSWPWADREKIIYKQSTCHLVPHKPLGLIEQRIQLLAKRNLLEHLNKSQNTQ